MTIKDANVSMVAKTDSTAKAPNAVLEGASLSNHPGDLAIVDPVDAGTEIPTYAERAFPNPSYLEAKEGLAYRVEKGGLAGKREYVIIPFHWAEMFLAKLPDA